MDAFIHPIRDAIAPRAYGLKNRERTNRLLMLMQLHDVLLYAGSDVDLVAAGRRESAGACEVVIPGT